MPRNLSNDIIAALSAPVLNLAVFCLLTFKSETIYLWTGVGDTTWNSHTWSGIGSFLNFTGPEDSSVVEAKGLTVTLSGIDTTLLPEALIDYKLGLPATIYLALYSSPGTLIDNPVVAWAGRMDQPTIDISGNEATISIALESRLLNMNCAIDRRYTQQDQQMTWPNDLGFMFVDGIQQITLFWGGFPTTSNNL